MTASARLDGERATSGDARPVRWRTGAVEAGLVFLGLAVILALTIWQSAEHLAPAEAGLAPRTELAGADGVLGPWLHWDAGYYRQIVDGGYTDAQIERFRSGQETTVAFFPGYPLLAAGARTVLGDTGRSLMLVTFVAGLAAAIGLRQWFVERLGMRSGRLALLLLLLFPWSFFLFGTGYGESLFLVAAVGSFALLERDRPLAAGLVGAVAAASRSVGIGVVLGLALRAVERSGALRFDGWRPRFDRSQIRRRDAGVLVAAAGLGGWLIYSGVRFGDPLAFSTSQAGWNQEAGPATWFKVVLLDQILHNPDLFFVGRLVVQGLVMIAFLATIPLVVRRFGFGYGAYTIGVLVLPFLGSAAFASNGRYVLMAFPVFGVAGERLSACSDRTIARVLIASGGALVFVASCWGRGYWMG